MSEGKPERTKVNFVLLKQILDDQESVSTDGEIDTVESDFSKSTDEHETPKDKENISTKGKEKDNPGPAGRYPVVFSKRCRSKSCQTRLSAFPLFSVPEETEWISDGEESSTIKRTPRKASEKRRRIKQRQTEDSPQSNISHVSHKPAKKKSKPKEVKEEEVMTTTTKNLDGTRKEFASEHQLKETVNPVLRAWIHQKNKLARKMKREERKEKRAKRVALEEEHRINEERKTESEKSVRYWLKSKKKEARQAWRQSHPKISPFDMDETTTDTPPPPPDYTVVKSFTLRQPTPSGDNSVQKSGSVTGLEAQSKNKLRSKIIVVQPQTEQHGLIHVRPKSAAAISDQKEVKSRVTGPRPRTSKGTPSRPKTASSVATADIPEKMQSMNYDKWLKCKREQDKKKVIKKKREIIDAHLDAVVAELGKQRVERILSPKKHVDTGLKNYKRTLENPAKSPTAVRKDNPYRWVTDKNVPRPEPQGCDCPDSDHPDMANNCNIEQPSTEQAPSSPSTTKKHAVSFCKEITDQCDELQPSMEKVLAVLDTEIKKSNDKKVSRNQSVLSTTGGTAGSDTVTSESDLVPNTKAKRPKSARPRSACVPNSNLTAEQARKKIAHDMDILGLCESEGKDISSSNSENNVTDNVADKSTVRDNYFDCSDADPPTIKLVSTS